MSSKSEHGQIRQRLLQLQRELRPLQDTGEDAARVVELDQTSVGRLSRMDALLGQAMSQERARRRQRELQLIADALRRLQMDPAANLCTRCASAREQR